jgi:hypothetical protein
VVQRIDDEVVDVVKGVPVGGDAGFPGRAPDHPMAAALPER